MSEEQAAGVATRASSFDSRTFRHAVGHFVTGVTIVVTEIGSEVWAMTADSFTSLSLDPSLVLFCVGKETKTGQVIHSAPGFSVNILRHGQQHVSTHFGRRMERATADPSSRSCRVSARHVSKSARRRWGAPLNRFMKPALTGSSSARAGTALHR